MSSSTCLRVADADPELDSAEDSADANQSQRLGTSKELEADNGELDCLKWTSTYWHRCYFE